MEAVAEEPLAAQAVAAVAEALAVAEAEQKEERDRIHKACKILIMLKHNIKMRRQYNQKTLSIEYLLRLWILEGSVAHRRGYRHIVA